MACSHTLWTSGRQYFVVAYFVAPSYLRELSISVSMGAGLVATLLTSSWSPSKRYLRNSWESSWLYPENRGANLWIAPFKLEGSTTRPFTFQSPLITVAKAKIYFLLKPIKIFELTWLLAFYKRALHGRAGRVNFSDMFITQEVVGQ